MDSDENVRMNSPAPTISTSESADLGDHQQAAEAERDSPTIDRPCSLIASFGETRVAASPARSRRAAPWRSPGGGEEQHAPVQAHVQRARRSPGPTSRSTSRRAPHCANSRPSSVPQREQRALGQQLPRDPPAGRAQRDAHAQLVPPRIRAGEQQVGDVGARDQEHQRDDRHDDVERIAGTGGRAPFGPLAAGAQR